MQFYYIFSHLRINAYKNHQLSVKVIEISNGIFIVFLGEIGKDRLSSFWSCPISDEKRMMCIRKIRYYLSSILFVLALILSLSFSLSFCLSFYLSLSPSCRSLHKREPFSSSNSWLYMYYILPLCSMHPNVFIC